MNPDTRDLRETRRACFTLALALGQAMSVPARAQTGPEVQRAQVNGIEMTYRVRGTGDPLVLLHGFGGCGLVWDPFIERLAQSYRLIIPDLRGHGGSTNPVGTFTHRQAASDVLALLDQLGHPRVRAMGISTGGMTLLHIATLIVHGDRDEFFPVNIPVEMYRAVPRSELWIVPGGGHVPIFGPGEAEFVRVVLRFLRGQ